MEIKVIVNISTINQHKKTWRLSPQTFEHKKDHDMVLEIQVLDWVKHTNVAGLNQLKGSQYFAYQIHR